MGKKPIKQVTIEKSGVRITVPEDLVRSHQKLGWWVVPELKSEPPAAPDNEFVYTYIPEWEGNQESDG